MQRDGAAATRLSGGDTPKQAQQSTAVDDDYGAAFNAERPSVEGFEACPRARRAGGLAVRAAVAVATVTIFRCLTASYPRAALALLILLAAAGRWIQARASSRRSAAQQAAWARRSGAKTFARCASPWLAAAADAMRPAVHPRTARVRRGCALRLLAALAARLVGGGACGMGAVSILFDAAARARAVGAMLSVQRAAVARDASAAARGGI